MPFGCLALTPALVEGQFCRGVECVVVPTQATAPCAQPWKPEGAHSTSLSNTVFQKWQGGHHMVLKEPKYVLAHLWKCQPSLQGEAACVELGVTTLSPFLSLCGREWTSLPQREIRAQWVWTCFVYECSLSRLRGLFWRPWNGFDLTFPFAMIHFCQQLFLTSNAT